MKGERHCFRRRIRSLTLPRQMNLVLVRGESGCYIAFKRLRNGLRALNEPAKWTERMRQVTNRAKAEGYASGERFGSGEIPRPRTIGARTCGIKFPISYIKECTHAHSNQPT
jgi:hypothetical protein